MLGANTGQSKHGVFTKKPGTLSNDFFVNLLDMAHGLAAGRRRHLRRPRPQDQSGQVDRHARRPDLRLALAAAGVRRGLCVPDAKEKFAKDFVAAWTKVMNADRFDIAA